MPTPSSSVDPFDAPSHPHLFESVVSNESLLLPA